MVIDVALPGDSCTRKKKYEKIEKYQGLKKELEGMWEVKAKEVPMLVGALRAVTPRAGRAALTDPRNDIRSLCPVQS